MSFGSFMAGFITGGILALVGDRRIRIYYRVHNLCGKDNNEASNASNDSNNDVHVGKSLDEAGAKDNNLSVSGSSISKKSNKNVKDDTIKYVDYNNIIDSNKYRSDDEQE